MNESQTLHHSIDHSNNPESEAEIKRKLKKMC